MSKTLYPAKCYYCESYAVDVEKSHNTLTNVCNKHKGRKDGL